MTVISRYWMLGCRVGFVGKVPKVEEDSRKGNGVVNWLISFSYGCCWLVIIVCLLQISFKCSMRWLGTAGLVAVVRSVAAFLHTSLTSRVPLHLIQHHKPVVMALLHYFWRQLLSEIRD